MSDPDHPPLLPLLESMSQNPLMCSSNATFPENFTQPSLSVSPISVVPHNLTRCFSFNAPEDVSPLQSRSDGVIDPANFVVYHTPNGTTLWIPSVSPEFKPVVGSVFNKWEDVVSMWYNYADKSGFTPRKGQTKRWKGVVTHKYLRCNKASKPQSNQKLDSMDEGSLNIRQSTFSVTDCKANICVVVSDESSKFTIQKFVEEHNHPLVERYNRDLSKISRKLSFSSKQFIHDMSLNRVGPVVAHRYLVTMKGGHHNVNGTPTDFKNFSQAMRFFIGDRDSQLVIDRFRNRKESLPNFFYDFVIEKGRLKSLFWADEISKLNYEVFGEVLAFDATYHTNKYNMIFVPFTGVDHHKQCVTFGAGLIANETVESYVWLLESFLKAHSTQPKLVLTDQDPAMKQAIAKVFSESRHRFCLWHIMKKLPLKISGDVLNNSDMRSCLHRLVWNVYIKPSTFESRWQALLEKFKLQDHDWLNDMYGIRESWAPAYFREIPFSCLMKTTSRCESSNSAFKVNSSSANTLVQFMLCYDTRIDNQRYRQRTAEYKTSLSTFKNSSDLPIEKHAFETYTHTIYEEVKKEIMKGKFLCYISNTVTVEDVIKYDVTQLDKENAVTHVFTVSVRWNDQDVTCSCNNFTRIGYLCRHVFCVFRLSKVDKIPPHYISDRWKRDVLPKRIFAIENRYGVDTSPQTVLRNEINDIFGECLDFLRSDIDGLSSFAEQIREMKMRVLNKDVTETTATNQNASIVEDLVGQSLKVNVSLNNPEGIRNKGRGKRRRLPGGRENTNVVSRVKRVKHPRLCRTCYQYVTDHDSRNCKMKEKDDTEDVETSCGDTEAGADV